MFDDMRSVQVTGGYMLYIESSSGENSKFALPLSKPAIAVEIATLFWEVYKNPDKTLSE